MIKVVVPISGGKDSQACLKLACEQYSTDEVMGLFCDTQFEHPWTYEHVLWMQDHYGVNIKRVSEGSVYDKVLKYKRFPSGLSRHCTDELKIQPSKKFYKALAEEQGGFEVWYGVRADESAQRKKRYGNGVAEELYTPHEYMKKYPKYLDKLGVMIRLPIIEWSRGDVMHYVGDELNPLYKHGFDRVGCFPCLAGGRKYQDQCYNFDETGRAHDALVSKMEEIVGHHDRYGKETDVKTTSGCSFCQE